MTVKEKIDDYIAKVDDWKGGLITEVRELIHEIEPGIVEEWKWNSPVFSYKGIMICSTGAFKNHVGLIFFNGAKVEDPDELFNSGLDAKKSRTINFHKEDTIDKKALKALLEKVLYI